MIYQQKKFNLESILSLAIFSCVLFFSSCQPAKAPAPKKESIENKSIESKTNENKSTFLFSSQSANSFISIDNPNGSVNLSGDSAEVLVKTDAINPGAEKAFTKVTKLSDASRAAFFTFEWKDTWRAAINFETKESLALAVSPENLQLEFDVQVNDLTKGGVAIKRPCKTDCVRQVPFVLKARALTNLGWQHVSVPYACLFHDGDDTQTLNKIISFEVGGAGSLSVADVKLVPVTKTNTASTNAASTIQLSCHDYKMQSTFAEPLNEWWAIDWWMPRHEKKLADLKAAKKIDLVFVGDSITEGWEKSGAPVWQKYYATRNAIALGFGGDRTENLLWRLQQGEIDGIDPKLLVMMIGTNNTGHRFEDPQLIATGMQRDIAEIQTRLPNTKILLLAIFPRDATVDGAMRQNNEKVNAIVSKWVSDSQKLGNKKIFFLNINSTFLTEQGELTKEIMPDLLHPNEKGYELWAKALEPTLVKLLKN